MIIQVHNEDCVGFIAANTMPQRGKAIDHHV